MTMERNPEICTDLPRLTRIKVLDDPEVIFYQDEQVKLKNEMRRKHGSVADSPPEERDVYQQTYNLWRAAYNRVYKRVSCASQLFGQAFLTSDSGIQSTQPGIPPHQKLYAV